MKYFKIILPRRLPVVQDHVETEHNIGNPRFSQDLAGS